MQPHQTSVEEGMTELHEIKREIEVLSEQRSELWTRLSQGFDATVSTELKEIDARLNRSGTSTAPSRRASASGTARRSSSGPAPRSGSSGPRRAAFDDREPGGGANPPCRLAYYFGRTGR